MCQTTVKPFSSDSLPELIRFTSFLDLAERECCHTSHVAFNAFSEGKQKHRICCFLFTTLDNCIVSTSKTAICLETQRRHTIVCACFTDISSLDACLPQRRFCYRMMSVLLEEVYVYGGIFLTHLSYTYVHLRDVAALKRRLSG